MRPITALLGALSLSLAACGGSGTPPAPLPPGKTVTTPAFETYLTNDTKLNRVRSKIPADSSDKAALAGFDSAAGGPAGYLRTIDLKNPYGSEMRIEVIAEVKKGTETATRLVRLTADQSQLVNEQGGKLIDATGQYHFEGESFAWVTVDDGPLLAGSHKKGLEHLMVDFETGTASINVRTGVSEGSDVRIEFAAEKLPFNIRSGAYGGDIDIQVLDPGLTGTIAGSVRGNIGGKPGFANDQHSMTTSGLFTGKGTLSERGTDREVSVDGVYFGRDPNAKP